MWSPSAALRVIVVAGCLAMAYTQLTMSPAVIEYARTLGGTGAHIGLLGALPTMTLFAQFLAAILANHLRHRRWVWFTASIVQRLVFVPVALGPWLWPGLPDSFWLWALIVGTAVNHGLLNFGTPLWLSWMGDYLPRSGLSRFWGTRHQWMQWAAAASLFGGAWYLRSGGLELRDGFSVLLLVGAVVGVADILLFLWVDEPEVTRVPQPRLRDVLAAPFRHANFRRFIGFTCFWHFAAMTAAPFISWYLLRHIGMNVDRVLLLWTFSWVGGAICSSRMGRWAETLGNRPVLVFCTLFKSTNVIALLLVPRDPDIAFLVLAPVFAFDAILNAGITIANNGFLLKNSPAENRTMYIAAGTALAGMVGGVTSIVTGLVIASNPDWTGTLFGKSIVAVHVAFAVSLVLRLIAAGLAFGVREPDSRSPSHVFVQLVGTTPLRLVRFPLGLYRSWRERTGESDPKIEVESPIPDEADPAPEAIGTGG